MQPITIKLEDPNAPTVARVRKPTEPTVMEWKAFWSLFGASLSVVAAVIPTWMHVTWWITAAAAAVVSIVGMFFVDRIVHTADLFKPLDYDGKSRVVTFTRLGIGAYALWTVLYVLNPAMWIYLGLAMVGLVISVYWAARGVEWWVRRAKPKPVVEKTVVADAAYADVTIVQRFRPILDKAGHSRVRITRHMVVNDESGMREANQFLLQTPASGIGSSGTIGK